MSKVIAVANTVLVMTEKAACFSRRLDCNYVSRLSRSRLAYRTRRISIVSPMTT